nr:HyaD/HybD family hydrogenase maturation endopeptidase [Shewanella intestini]
MGIGNVLYADEGVGVHFTNYIAEKYTFSHSDHQLDIVDGGTLAQGLIRIICQYDKLIIVDTVNCHDAEYGDVYFFNFDQAPAEIDWQGSAHEVEMLQTLTMMDMVGDRPETHILGVVPTVIEPMVLGLTDKLYGAIPTMEKALLAHIESLGFSHTKDDSVKIEQVIPDAYKRGQIDAPYSV